MFTQTSQKNDRQKNTMSKKPDLKKPRFRLYVTCISCIWSITIATVVIGFFGYRFFVYRFFCRLGCEINWTKKPDFDSMCNYITY